MSVQPLLHEPILAFCHIYIQCVVCEVSCHDRLCNMQALSLSRHLDSMQWTRNRLRQATKGQLPRMYIICLKAFNPYIHPGIET